MQLNRRPDIIAVKAILDSGDEIALFQRASGNGSPSRCTFFGERADGSFTITLRIDWGDIDKNGDPILDADIYQHGKKYRTDRKKWHHTSKTLDHGEWVYVFEFGSVRLRFRLGITSQRHQTARSNIVSPPSPLSYKVVGEKQVFCALCQKEKTHELAVDANREIVATCECGHFVKFPLSEAGDELDRLLASHKRANRR